MTRSIVYTRVTGDQYRRVIRTGPKSSGNVHVHAYVQPEHLETMKARAELTGISVNEQIRRAIRMYNTDGLLSKPVYMGLVKP